MAFWKRRSQSFDPVSPQTRYTVTYLGHEEIRGRVGLDNTLKPVDDMYRQFKLHKSKSVSKMDIEVMNNGIKVEPLDAGVRTMFANSPYFIAEGAFGNVFFPINKLSFGAADPYHSKIFCFVSRNENPASDHYWDCHAVFCESSAMAKNLTLYLVKAFQRITASKTNPVGAAQENRRPTTVHILRERGTSEHQVYARRKKKPPVSTVSVTLNLDGKPNLKQTDDNTNSNRAVADIIAQRSKSYLVGESDVSNGNSVSKGVGTSNSDKENDLMDGIMSDEDITPTTSPRDVEVTVAFNPDLSSPPESPRKSPSPRGGRTSSEDDDVTFRLDPRSGETSPQDMITTMSPPDTPGYLSKEEKSPSTSLMNTPSKPPSPRQRVNSSKKTKAPSPPLKAPSPPLKAPSPPLKAPSPPLKAPSPPLKAPTGNTSSIKQDSTSDVVLRKKAPPPSAPIASSSSPRKLNNTSGADFRQETKRPTTTTTNSSRKQEAAQVDNLRRDITSPPTSKTPIDVLPGCTSKSPSPVSTPPLKSSPPRTETETSEVVSRRRSPQSTMTSAAPCANADDSVAVQKKSRRERKSVRFNDEVHIRD